MKTLLAISILALATFAASAQELGQLNNYYGDCPARNGPHSAELRRTIREALRGYAAAMRLVIMHDGIYSTGDSEGYSEVPQALLRTLGDARYSQFVIHQRHVVQQAALAVFPEQIAAFDCRFPKTAKLYRERSHASHECLTMRCSQPLAPVRPRFL